MQHTDEKSLHLKEKLGKTIRRIREEKTGLSCSKLANEYGLYSGHLTMIENGQIDCKFVTMWKISEALGMKLSEFVKVLEDELGEDFTLIDL